MRRLALSLALLAVPSAGFAETTTASPLSGTWVANLEKSHRHENHQFQSATLTFVVSGEVSADGKTLTTVLSGTDASGRSFAQTIVFDRK